MRQTIENKAKYRIRGAGGGWAFSPRDFLDLGGRPTVDSALHRLEKRGEIRRVIRGIYDYPRFNKLLDQHLSPDIDQVARALARKFRWRIQPSGATALNFLGLSTQVPARAV
jgi:predicted transcriptional regulator of viral defense system